VEDLLARPGPLDFDLDHKETRARLELLARYGVDLGLTRSTLASAPSAQLAETVDILSLRSRIRDPQTGQPVFADIAPRPVDVFRSFNDHDVHAVLIGGMAASLRGAPYVTRDLDFCYDPSDQNRCAIVAALSPLNPELDNDDQLGRDAEFHTWPDAVLHSDDPLSLHTDAGDVDLFVTVLGVGDYYAVRAAASVVYVSGALSILALDLPDILVSKVIVDRPGDRQHIYEIEAALRLRGSVGLNKF